MKQYKSYKASEKGWIREIPSEWDIIKIKFTDKLIMGQSPDSKDVTNFEKGLPFLQGNAEFTETHPIPENWCETPNKTAIEGDLLLSVRAPVGEINISNQTYGIGRGLCAIRPKKNLGRFLYYVLLVSKEELNKYASGSTFTAITMQNLNNIFIPKVSKDEQIQIVKYLDFKTNLIDGFIANRQKQIDLLKEQLRKKIFTALTKGLSNKDFKPSDLPWFTEIPVNWEMYKFNAAIKLLHGFQFRDNHFKEQGVKVAKITQLKADGSLDLSEASLVDEKFLITLKKKIIKNGDILMALTGGTIGKIIRVENLEEEVLQNYRVGKFVPKDTRTLDKDFMFWVLSSEFTFAQILFLQRETGQPNIGIGDFSKMFFPMPDTLEEQREIAAYIVEQKNETNTLISKYQKQIDLMQEYRTAIISQAVTGKIDVRDWQPKTKEVLS